MHQVNDDVARHHARARAETAVAAAGTHRLRVVSGTDGRARAVALLGRGADRLRERSDRRRTIAGTGPDDTVVRAA